MVEERGKERDLGVGLVLLHVVVAAAIEVVRVESDGSFSRAGEGGGGVEARFEAGVWRGGELLREEGQWRLGKGGEDVRGSEGLGGCAWWKNSALRYEIKDGVLCGRKGSVVARGQLAARSHSTWGSLLEPNEVKTAI